VLLLADRIAPYVPYVHVVHAARCGHVARGYVARMTELDDLAGIPRYVQVARIIESEIRTGIWKPGSAVPSQIVLNQRFGIAKTTAGKAHAWLAERGLVVAVPGVGMVVTPRDRWSKPEV
jgi:DNA-binding GntR family transcriptional regulator